MEKIRILIADDSEPFRKGLRSLFLGVEDIELVGEADSGEAVVRFAEQYQPDVVLMDLQMPQLHGIEATRQILHTSPHIRILIFSMYEDNESFFAALQAGARGYLLKGALKAEVLRAVRGVFNGEAIFSPAIAKRLIDYFAAVQPALPAKVFPELTGRETEILQLIAQHLTNPEIAGILKISPKTVRNHVSNIFTKLQVVDRAQAIIRAREAGLG